MSKRESNHSKNKEPSSHKRHEDDDYSENDDDYDSNEHHKSQTSRNKSKVKKSTSHKRHEDDDYNENDDDYDSNEHQKSQTSRNKSKVKKSTSHKRHEDDDYNESDDYYDSNEHHKSQTSRNKSKVKKSTSHKRHEDDDYCESDDSNKNNNDDNDNHNDEDKNFYSDFSKSSYSESNTTDYYSDENDSDNNNQNYMVRSMTYKKSPKSQNKRQFSIQRQVKVFSQSQAPRTRRCDSDYKVDTKTQQGRKLIAKKTLDIISKGPRMGKYTIRHRHQSIENVDISKLISNSIKYSKTFEPNAKIEINPSIHKNQEMCKFEVISDSTLGVARKYVTEDHLKTCILNFASATKPGGGFLNGRQAQEESLARQSALYVTIKDSPMYESNKKCEDDFYNDYMIYSSRVPVFRSSFRERLLGQNEVFLSSIITSAAPNLQNINRSCSPRLLLWWKNYKPKIKKRMEKIIKLAINNGTEALVLGAYGCGVFENDPKIVSDFFYDILYKEEFGKYFKKVAFAIISKKSENFRVFNGKFINIINK